MRFESREDFITYRDTCIQQREAEKLRILICGGTGCISGGSEQIYERMKMLVGSSSKVSVEFGPEIAHKNIKFSGCNGFCEMGPLVRIEPYDYLYVHVKPEDCEDIYNLTICQGKPVPRLLYSLDDKIYEKQSDIPFYSKQTRIVLRNCGNIDAENIADAIGAGVYDSFVNVLFDSSREAVIETVKASGLRGRGGAGFPTGKKWEQVNSQEEEIRYVVCNGDEGDPGAFMDRSIMEGDSHSLLEGMMIASYAVNAHDAYIYVRAEYPLAVQRLRIAIRQAEEIGLLGDHILGTDFSLHMHINTGAGAFVCGEGSALTASIEGKRGMPRVKPPRTVERGLWEKPTVLNNVETYANIPIIIKNGVDWFRSHGSEKSPGTKAFAITGNIKNTGLVEIPMGITMRELIYDIGGGIPNGKKLKAVQIGGPSGGCLTEEQLDTAVDFDSLKKMGAMIGSGGLVVMDEDTCMVEVARFFMSFTQRESCGKCVPCREGTKRMLEILQRMVDGKARPDDIEKLEELAGIVKEQSLCGLGKSAPQPVLSTLANFREEYREHVFDKKCRAHVCSALLKYTIDPAICKGCGKCARNCPTGAIFGAKKCPHVINNAACMHCGSCISNCAFDAIKAEW